jgi:hypothetical protein
MSSQKEFKRNHTIDQCIKSLSKKKDISINTNRMIILIEQRKKHKLHDLGNKSWGRIDFLRSQGFMITYNRYK